MTFDPRPILEANVAAREQEIGMYGLNIDNYKRSLALIEDQYKGNEPLHVSMRTEHRARLEGLLLSEQQQCEIAKLALKAQLEQLAALPKAGN